MSKIFTALHEAYKTTGYVQKTGNNSAQNYRFAGEAAFIEAVRPALFEQGVIFYPSAVKVISSGQYTTAKGGVMNRVVSEYTFTFAHKDGETLCVAAVGEGADSGDKAAYKAATGALKYALRQALLIETGDDPDDKSPEPAYDREKDPNFVKAKKTVEKGVAALSALPDQFARAAYISDPEKADAVKALRWVKETFPDLMKPIEDLGIQL